MSLPAWLDRRGWLIAASGAVAATAGDLGQLWVVNAARPSLHLAAPPPSLIIFATLAGALGIPLYGIGYFVRAQRARRDAPRLAALVMIAGAAFAVLGAVVHTATGVLIAYEVGGITHDLDPLQGILASGPLVLTLWGLASAALIVAGTAEAALPQRHAARCFSPLLLTVAITLAAPLAGSPWRDFLAPASVNIAHFAFFSVGVRGSRGGSAARDGRGAVWCLL